MRVKRGVTAHKRHKKIFKANKGFTNQTKNVFRRAKEAWIKAGQHAYIGRKLKKRQFRGLWIVRINAALDGFGVSYSKFMNKLTKAKVGLNRKVLSELAINQKEVFAEIVKKVKGEV